ncbi:MAG: hypothetical protein J6J13_00155 [Clostridia bacterium]|nr:hypothetical protein [Clostridia bacterium]
MKAIGIDIGTTSICGVVIDIKTGELIKSVTKDSNAFISGVADWEKIQSVEKIITIASEILDSLITDDIAVIGVTGQMHGIVYIDKSGSAVSPLYTWQDGRGNQPFGDTTYAEFLGSSAGFGNVTDFYNKQNGLVPETAVGFCTIHDYLVMRLCGLEKPQIHITDAASFGLFDLKSKRFTCENGIAFVEDYKIAGEYKSIAVSVAIGDNQASVLSSLSSQDELLINVGTGSQVSVVSDDIITSNNVETRPFFENKYIAVGAALCGGRAYAVLKDFYKSILSTVADVDDKTVYSLMSKFFEEEVEGLLVDTRFVGTRADKTIRGSIHNISVENFTPAALTKGVLEGMIKELYDMYKSMGVNIKGIVGSGNGIRKNKTLIKAAEKSFGYNLKIPYYTEEAAFGAALYGMISAGYYQNLSEAGKIIKFI